MEKYFILGNVISNVEICSYDVRLIVINAVVTLLIIDILVNGYCLIKENSHHQLKLKKC